MKFLAVAAALSAMLSVVSGQGSNMSLCDKYTTALLKDNNSTNQLTVLTLVVNTALIGNYSNATGPAKNRVTGILNNGTYNGEPVSLLPYFNGKLVSANRNGVAKSVNFLDGGGAAPLMQNMAAFANASSSNQNMLVTHLYEFFGALLGCSQMGPSQAFKNYQGSTSMSEVHRFMNLNTTQNNYFIQQVGQSATSFGVSAEDATTIGNLLNTTFNVRCAPPTAVIPGAQNSSQSICLASECPVAQGATCTAADNTNAGNGTGGAAPAVNSSVPSTGGGSGGSGGSGGGHDGSSALIVNVIALLALVAGGAIAVGI